MKGLWKVHNVYAFLRVLRAFVVKSNSFYREETKDAKGKWKCGLLLADLAEEFLLGFLRHNSFIHLSSRNWFVV